MAKRDLRVTEALETRQASVPQAIMPVFSTTVSPLPRRRNRCVLGEMSNQIVSYYDRSAADRRLRFYWKERP